MNDKKTIWIINQYAGTPQTNNPGRHFYIAKQFIKKGYKAVIITATYTHKREYQLEDATSAYEEIDGVGFFWVNVNKYNKVHGLGRIINWFLFAYKISVLYKKKFNINKPDLIYYSSLSLIGYLGAEKLRNKFKVPLVFEIRDIWPLTLQELKGVSKKNPFVFFLRKIEMRGYRNSDVIVSNLSNFKLYLTELGFKNKKFLWIPNGVEGELTKYQNQAKVSKKDSFKIGYTGTLGTANKMDVFIRAANSLKDNDKFEFHVLGTGPEIENLKEICENKNVIFMDSIPKSEVQKFIDSVDACYLGWSKSVLYNYGIGANKFVDYMLSGKPILHSYSGLGDPVKMFGIGLSVPSEDPDLLKYAMIKASLYTSNELLEIRENSFHALSDFYRYDENITKLVRMIDVSND